VLHHGFLHVLAPCALQTMQIHARTVNTLKEKSPHSGGL
jgi:hypothetical protein